MPLTNHLEYFKIKHFISNNDLIIFMPNQVLYSLFYLLKHNLMFVNYGLQWKIAILGV